MNALIDEFNTLYAFKISKLLEMEEIVPKLPKFIMNPIKIMDLDVEYTLFKKIVIANEKEDKNYFNYYSKKDIPRLKELINLEYLVDFDNLTNFYDIFNKIEEKQNIILKKLKNKVSNECPKLVNLLGKEKTSIILCELGSLKRLTEIPSNNLKGLGYCNNFIFEQKGYFYGIKKNLRSLCSEVSWAAKMDFYKFNRTKFRKEGKTKKEEIFSSVSSTETEL